MSNWNSLVNSKDEVIIAGDFAYRRHKHFITSLNGKKVLVKGNHDKSNSDFYGEFGGLDKIAISEEAHNPEEGILYPEVRKECNSALKRFRNGNIDMEECTTIILTAAWARFLELNDFCSIDQMSKECYNNFSEVHEMGCRKIIEGKDITICHYALRSWASSCHGSYVAYGHSHGRMPEFDNMLACDVGVDVWGYAPVPFDAFLRKMEIKENWMAKNGKYAEGQYDKDPEARVIETRRKNKAIMKDLGYPINEVMWPNT
jgi:calcineurin-like phosphoesterase family protein